MLIKRVKARTILDSCGYPTVEVDVITGRGLFRASVANAYTYYDEEGENVPLLDGGPEFCGRSVSGAVRLINEKLGPAIQRRFATTLVDQEAIDKFIGLELDNTTRKSCNASAALSLALLRAGADEANMSVHQHVDRLLHRHEKRVPQDSFCLPAPHVPLLDSGSLTGGPLPFHSLYIVPTVAKSYAEAIRICSEVTQTLRALIISRYGRDRCLVSYKGAFAPPVTDLNEAFCLIVVAVKEAGHCGRVRIGIEAQARNFYTADGNYNMDPQKPDQPERAQFTSSLLLEQYNSLIANFPICSIDDPFVFRDEEVWKKLLDNERIQVVADTFLNSRQELLAKHGYKGMFNAVTMRPSQASTVTDLVNFAREAKAAGLQCILSDRLGETECSLIADLAVGLGCSQVKFGSLLRTDRVCKHNQLLRIEEQLDCNAGYAVPDKLHSSTTTN